MHVYATFTVNYSVPFPQTKKCTLISLICMYMLPLQSSTVSPSPKKKPASVLTMKTQDNYNYTTLSALSSEDYAVVFSVLAPNNAFIALSEDEAKILKRTLCSDFLW